MTALATSRHWAGISDFSGALAEIALSLTSQFGFMPSSEINSDILLI